MLCGTVNGLLTARASDGGGRTAGACQ